jgi:hypothetical protein
LFFHHGYGQFQEAFLLLSTMKSIALLSLSTFVWLQVAVDAFQPIAMRPPMPSRSCVFSEPAENNEGLDLDLGEMFEMFEAADKGQDFDKALEKVKSSSEN